MGMNEEYLRCSESLKDLFRYMKHDCLSVFSFISPISLSVLVPCALRQLKRFRYSY